MYIDYSFIDTITPLQWTLLGILLLAFFIQLYYYLYLYNAVLRVKRRARKGNISFENAQPPISVIVCAKNESENLARFLPLLLEQDYPEFEVIVVNEGSTDESNDILAEFSQKYSNLYHTYVPEGVKLLGTKKLALTVGIKAAKNDILLFTDANCKPVSDNWIANMIRNFSPHTDIVLGFSGYEKEKNVVSRLVSFNNLVYSLRYLGAAINRRPYMGIGRNMAYRKELFFNTKGFASILHLPSGDDDLFINKNATRKNTRVEISKESKVFATQCSHRNFFINKELRLSSMQHYTFFGKYISTAEMLSRGLFYAFLIILPLVGNAPVWITVAALYLIRLVIQEIVINRSAHHFDEQKSYFLLPLFDIYLLLMQSYIFVAFNLFHRKRMFRWK